MDIEIKSHPWYHQAHHRPAGGFQNIWGPPRDAPPAKVFRWVLSRAFQGKENEVPSVHPPEQRLLAAPPERLRITWIGHATTYLQAPSLDLLTDPMFSHRASPLPFAGPERKVPPPLEVEDLPGVDVVLISHDHYDHLDKQTITRVQQRFAPLFLVPLGIAAIVRRWGAARVVELDWWQYVDVHGMRYHCTPARHFSGRGLTNRDGTLWASWYLQAHDGSLKVYFAGDSAYGGHFTEIREGIGPPEVALMPIGAYEPRWLMGPVHVNPKEAVKAFMDLRARHCIGIHWGTFDLSDEPLHEPPALWPLYAAERNVSDRVHLLDIGGHFSLSRRTVPLVMSRRWE